MIQILQFLFSYDSKSKHYNQSKFKEIVQHDKVLNILILFRYT